MKRRSIAAAVIALVAALGLNASYAQSLSSITIDKPFSRATPAGAKVGAGYMTIMNKGTVADRLISASSPAAGKVEIHEMKMDGGVMKMREIPGGVPIEAGKSVSLAPGGYHLMLMDLKAPLKQGDKVPVTMTFEKAGKIDVTLDVQSIGAQMPKDMPMPSDNSGHMHKM
jgi:copper(I)-binding protein